MTRTWCPALAADLEEPLSPRSKETGDAAAKSASTSFNKVDDNYKKQAASPPSHFSAKVAMSTSLTTDPTVQGFTRVQVVAPQSALKVTVPDEENINAAQPAAVSVHCAKHLALLPAISTMPKEGSSISNLALVQADCTSEELAAVLQQPLLHDSLTNLRVHGTMRSSTGLASLVSGLSTHIRSLDVGMNPACFSVGEEVATASVDALMKYLKDNATTLRSLGLAATGLAPASTTLLPALTAHGSVTDLDLSRNSLGLGDEAAVAALVQLVQENKFLLSLNLDHNDINAATSKLLLEALQNSNTRVKTPEVEPEPEVEEFTDEVPPEEEAPTVTVGFPQEEEAAPIPEEAAEGGDIPPPTEADPPADVDVTAEPEQEGETPAPEDAAADPNAQEMDPEEAEALRQEALEREAEELRQKEAEWRAKMQQYIWEPEQILFAYSEGVARRLAIQEYVTESLALKKQEKLSKAEFKELQLARERRERERRSGWTHLQRLHLSGNVIGNDGAKALAAAVRHRVPLPAEELATREEESAQKLAALRAAATEERRIERRRQAAEAAAAAAAAPQVEEVPPPAEEEAVAQITEDVLDAVTVEDAPLDEDAPQPEADDAPAETAAEEGGAEEEAEEVIDVSDVTVPPIEDTKPGVLTISMLSLNSCGIGVAGMTALAATIGDNLPSLEVLLLQRNKFGTKKQTVVGEAATEDDEPPKFRVEMPEWVSPAIAALSKALTTAPNLTTLDLGYNKLYPVNIRLLATGIRSSPSLQYLNLEGNYIGAHEEGVADQTSALASLLEAVATQGKVHSLVLGSNQLEVCLTEVEWTLLSTISQLRVLSLNNTPLTAEQLAQWAKILSDLGQQEQQSGSVPLTNLEVLSMENNVAAVGAAAGEALAAIIRHNASLKEVSFRGCTRFGDSGIAPIASALGQYTKGLRQLDLHRTGLTSLAPINPLLGKLASLEMIDVADNEFSEASGVQFLKACASGVCGKLCGLALWRRRGDSDTLLPECIETILRLPSLVHCDVGIPLAFARTAANVNTTTTSDEDSRLQFADVFEELEVTSLANRVRAVNP